MYLMSVFIRNVDASDFPDIQWFIKNVPLNFYDKFWQMWANFNASMVAFIHTAVEAGRS